MKYYSSHFFTPPYLLENIIINGEPSQKKKALTALKMAGQMRGRRQAVINIEMPFERELSKRKRGVYSAMNKPGLPGKLIRAEGDSPSADMSVNEAYDGAGATYDLFAKIFGRDSIDGRGMKIVSTVHYLTGYDNAFWNGEQMVYGDGDEDMPESERIFNRFTSVIDIIGHELTHGVTQFEASLNYWEQPGALCESFSDIFGILVKQMVLNQKAEDSDWLIGKGLFTDNVRGKALRSMKEPGTAYSDRILGKDPQPAHMKDYIATNSDNGGVHLNSGIPNRAFCLAAMEMGGYAWEKAGRIWYLALCDRLKEDADFKAASEVLIALAGSEYGSGSPEQKAVKSAWRTVGVDE